MNLEDFHPEDETEAKADPDYNYTIQLVDGTEVPAHGYIVVGHGFYAVARGKGVLYHIWPESQIRQVINNGPVAEASSLN